MAEKETVTFMFSTGDVELQWPPLALEFDYKTLTGCIRRCCQRNTAI